jgi:hypothetical protein
VNPPTPFLIHLYPLFASFVRAEAPRDEEVLLVTTHFTHSLLSQPHSLFASPTPLRFEPCVPHPLRPLAQTIALRGPHSKQSPIPPTTTIFRTYIDIPPFDFDFPRQSDEEIEARLIVVRTRDLSNLPPLTIDQKCNMVESDERLRFNAEKAREEQAKKVLK